MAASALTPSNLINPTSIFGQQISNNANTNVKYTTLTNLTTPDLNMSNNINLNNETKNTGNINNNNNNNNSSSSGSSSSNSSSSTNAGNFYVLQQQSMNDINNNNSNTNANMGGGVAYDLNNNLASKSVKDELQTVPVHPNFANKQSEMNNAAVATAASKKGANKKRNNTGELKVNSNVKINTMNGIKKDDMNQKINENLQHQPLTVVELKSENDFNVMGTSSGYMNNNVMPHGMMMSKRRDTENSNSTASSSNMDSSTFSPINMDGQETLKLEKKRERNREAARKCRTRKLEKIATLEQQVKNLVETNKQEEAKSRSLNDEIINLRKKLEAHQKLHNCNINFNI